MLEIHARTDKPGPAMGHDTLTLTLIFQDRQRSRLRVTLNNGEQAALLLPRGQVLRGGDTLALSDGRAVWVVAAPELVSTVRARVDQAEMLARAAYHLGNRHVPLQVGAGYLRYLRDHVLDAMVLELGLELLHEEAPFEPESGAYGKHTHGPGHHPGHAHAHELVPGVKRAVSLVELSHHDATDSPEGSRAR